jgi:hypothetical protein
MEKPAFTVICRRRSGRWEITIPDVPDLALVVERLEDVPAAARTAIARGQKLDAGEVHVLLDVHGG